MITPVTASHRRVAWAWLEKLVSQPPKRLSKPPPALSMTAREREKLLQDAYDSIKQEVISTLKAEIPKIERAESIIAKRHGIDPLYLDWFIINGEHWPSMSPRQSLAMEAIQNTKIWYGAVPDDWHDKVVPEISKMRDRDRAMRELADWFLRNTVALIERKYVNSIWKHSRELVRAFRGTGSPTDPKASLLLMSDFKRRFLADRFRLKPAIWDIVDLLD
jgi:hypothetical protein